MNAMGRQSDFEPRGKRVICFGEVMAELAGLEAETVRVGVGGDTFNTAVYLARLGTPVRYATALGADPFSLRIRQRMELEGVADDLVMTAPDRNCGLYAIELDDTGERSFTYWRSQSAARQFLDMPQSETVLAEMAKADVLYLSGISLSLFQAPRQLEKLVDLVRAVRSSGGEVVFDTNYRPAGWASKAQAGNAIRAVMPMVSLALPTFEDEQALFDFDHVEACGDFWRDAGVSEVIVKCGPRGAWSGRDRAWVAPPEIITPLDTTGAGDSFNAGYLHARLSGASCRESISRAHALAAAVLGVRGALLPTGVPLPGQFEEQDRRDV